MQKWQYASLTLVWTQRNGEWVWLAYYIGPNEKQRGPYVVDDELTLLNSLGQSGWEAFDAATLETQMLHGKVGNSNTETPIAQITRRRFLLKRPVELTEKKEGETHVST